MLEAWKAGTPPASMASIGASGGRSGCGSATLPSSARTSHRPFSRDMSKPLRGARIAGKPLERGANGAKERLAGAGTLLGCSPDDDTVLAGKARRGAVLAGPHAQTTQLGIVEPWQRGVECLRGVHSPFVSVRSNLVCTYSGTRSPCFSRSLRASAAVPAPQPFWKHIGRVARCTQGGGALFLNQSCGSMSFSYGPPCVRTKASTSSTGWCSAAPKPRWMHSLGRPTRSEPSRSTLAFRLFPQ